MKFDNNLSYKDFMEIAGNTMDKWKYSSFNVDSADENYLFYIWFKIYHYIICDEITSYFYINSIKKEMYKDLNSKFAVIKIMCTNNKIDHRNLEAVLDPLNTYLLKFKKTHYEEMVNYIKPNVINRIEKTILKFTENKVKKTISLKDLFIKNKLTIPEVNSFIVKLISWSYRETIDILFIKYLETTKNLNVEYILTDIEMFYTNNLLSMNYDIKYINKFNDELQKIDTLSNSESNKLIIKIFNFLFHYKNIDFVNTELGKSLQQYVFSLKSDINNTRILPENIKNELKTFMTDLIKDISFKFDNVYNYNVLDDIANYIFNPECPAEPGFLDVLEKFNGGNKCPIII